MKLVSAEVGPFKSINSAQIVQIEDDVTVFVGMNEAGKTVFLQALAKANDALGTASYNPVDDYPRKDLSAYLKRHKENPKSAAVLTYRLTDAEVASVNAQMAVTLPKNFQFSVTHLYDNKLTISLSVDESHAVAASAAKLSSDPKAKATTSKSFRGIPKALEGVALTDADKVVVAAIEARIAKTEWMNVIQWEVWTSLKTRIPKFLYFSDYDLLPSKINLTDLAQRVAQSASDPKQLQPKHRAVLALLRMADISIDEFTTTGGYEPLKAKIEGVSISLTDQIMEFWKQNEDLEVEVDIKSDSEDEAPFNNGPNLYLRIKNRRHRGVSTPFAQRSRGFIWFFSFLVWFDSVQHQLDSPGAVGSRDMILLLDEPGLALHALAQADFLRYIDDLSSRHQVLYTTHSPFMVHSDRLNQVRVVEDKDKIGTVISSDVGGSDPRTIFPLQAALGWTIAQNLFVSERNFLVEGPSELLYLKSMSALLESLGKPSLNENITIVPVGGLDKLVTFIALLGASGLKLAVLHDYRGVPEQKLVELVKEKIIAPKLLLNASQFRDLAAIGTDGKASDTEDLFEEDFYLTQFNEAFKKELGEKQVKGSELPKGDRIIERIERLLSSTGIQIRPSGGFNHYRVAAHFSSKQPKKISDQTVDRFAALFEKVNNLLA